MLFRSQRLLELPSLLEAGDGKIEDWREGRRPERLEQEAPDTGRARALDERFARVAGEEHDGTRRCPVTSGESWRAYPGSGGTPPRSRPSLVGIIGCVSFQPSLTVCRAYSFREAPSGGRRRALGRFGIDIHGSRTHHQRPSLLQTVGHWHWGSSI